MVAHDPAAMLAGTPWLDVFCPGCGTSRAIDLRTLDRHPLASVGTLVLDLRVLMLSRVSADAEATRLVRSAASEAGRRCGALTPAFPWLTAFTQETRARTALGLDRNANSGSDQSK